MFNLKPFTPRNNRTISKGDLVGVHWNSHRGCYSILLMKTRNSTGVVLGYASNVNLEEVTFKIEKSKQESVRQTGVKDRHAFVVGKLSGFEAISGDKKIIYNPHKMDTFSLNTSKGLKELICTENAYMTSIDGKPSVSFEGAYETRV